ncbi:hypothetical protein ACFHWW_07050 [Ensifer sp. P24N7]|uniref:hypothetical protein n=1 Tax=Sinorhizobium sp. P24N7 TaxID=3348358 RepID=UPI0035F2DD8B
MHEAPAFGASSTLYVFTEVVAVDGGAKSGGWRQPRHCLFRPLFVERVLARAAPGSSRLMLESEIPAFADAVINAGCAIGLRLGDLEEIVEATDKLKR